MDKARVCKKCGYKWWAAKASKPKKISTWDTINDSMLLSSAAARTAKAAHERSMKLPAWERFTICARCGSTKIDSRSSRGFRTSAQEEAEQAQQTAITVARAERSVPPETDSPFRAGDRVLSSAFGSKGKTGEYVRRAS